jgi:tetratricopeptide (TPR) repeat protein
LAINPNSLKGRLRYSDVLVQSRDFRAALNQLEKLMIIDPLSALIYKRLGRLFYLMGEHETATAYLDDALDLEPGSLEAFAVKGAIYAEAGRYEDALACFEESLRSQYQIEIVAMIGAVYAKMGDLRKALAIVKKVEEEARIRGGNAIMLAHLYLAVGKKADAYAALDRAYSQHEPDIRALTYDRRWIQIRNEARFRELIRRVGLPAIQD